MRTARSPRRARTVASSRCRCRTAVRPASTKARTNRPTVMPPSSRASRMRASVSARSSVAANSHGVSATGAMWARTVRPASSIPLTGPSPPIQNARAAT
jgi:hypothetical protein